MPTGSCTYPTGSSQHVPHRRPAGGCFGSAGRPSVDEEPKPRQREVDGDVAGAAVAVAVSVGDGVIAGGGRGRWGGAGGGRDLQDGHRQRWI